MYIVLFIAIIIIIICFSIVSYYTITNSQNILILRWFQMSGIMIALFLGIIPTKKNILESKSVQE